MKFVYFDFKKDKKLICSCGCGLKVKDIVVNKLDKARAISGIPYIITSGGRCKAYNMIIGGAKNSSHIKGLAVDIAFKDEKDMLRIFYGLTQVGFKRFIFNRVEKYIHVDLDDTKSDMINVIG